MTTGSEQSTFIIGCCNLTGRDGGYLLVQEAKASAWTRFNLPAGKPEPGETLIEAAEREAKEETGLDVRVQHIVGIYQSPRTSEGFGVVNFVFYSEVISGSVTTSEAHPVVRYFSRREIDQLLVERMVRGRHIPLAISDHERGIAMPLSLLQVVPELEPPDESMDLG